MTTDEYPASTNSIDHFVIGVPQELLSELSWVGPKPKKQRQKDKSIRSSCLICSQPTRSLNGICRTCQRTSEYKATQGEICTYPGCNVTSNSRGMCPRHYQRWRKHGHPSRAKSIRRFDRHNDKGERLCSSCRLYLPITEFTKNEPRRCSLCCIGRSYKLTRPEYLKILEGVCPICLKRPKEVVDHDHACCPSRHKSCGKCVRGGLCRHCNLAIGIMTEEGIERALLHLTAYKNLRESLNAC